VLAEQEALKATDDAGDILCSGPKVSVTASHLRECQTRKRASAVAKVQIDDPAAFYINLARAKSVPLLNHPIIEIVECSS